MSDAPRPSYQRSARNYLLDKPFQLKYTGFLVAIAVVMSGALGALLYFSSRTVVKQSERTVELGNETVDQSRETVSQGQEAVKQGQKAVELGQASIADAGKMSALVKMQIEACYPDDPALKHSFQTDADADESKRKANQASLEDDTASLEKKAENLASRAASLESRAADLSKQKDEIARGQRYMFIGLVSALSLLVVAIGVAGIVFTHKIAGPIFKMKRLMRQVGEGKLVLREKLRKGDELQHFFETFEQMVESMRENQRNEIKRAEKILERLDAGGTYQKEDVSSARADLEKLVADMKDHISA